MINKEESWKKKQIKMWYFISQKWSRSDGLVLSWFYRKPKFWPWEWVAEINAVIHWDESVMVPKNDWAGRQWQSSILPKVLTMNLDNWPLPLCLKLHNLSTSCTTALFSQLPLFLSLHYWLWDIHSMLRKVWRGIKSRKVQMTGGT